MGTRSLTHIEDRGKILTTIYRQFDGYISGHGQEVAEFLAGRQIVNGFEEDNTVFNGMGCLAAQLIAKLKDGVGNIYVYPAGENDCGEEYTYYITGEVGREANIRVLGWKGKELFNGPASKLVKFKEPEE